MASLSCGYVQRIALTHTNLHVRKKSRPPIIAVVQQKMYSYLTRFKNVAFHAKIFLLTTTKGPPPHCVPQGPHHPRSTPVYSIKVMYHFQEFLRNKNVNF